MKRPALPPELSFKCPKAWGEMKGDDRRRFCDHCQLHVHNLSEMSQRASERLLASRGEQCCVIYRTSADGGMVTASRWNRLRRSSAKVLRGLVAILAVAFPMFAGSRLQAGSPDPKDGGTQQTDKSTPRPKPDGPETPTMGMIALPRPTPKPSPSPTPTHRLMGRVAPGQRATK